jgi:hypothetical protein
LVDFVNTVMKLITTITTTTTTTPWLESASEVYHPSDSRLLVSTFADRGYHMVSVTDLYGRILGFLDRYETYMSINTGNFSRNNVALQMFKTGLYKRIKYWSEFEFR